MHSVPEIPCNADADLKPSFFPRAQSKFAFGEEAYKNSRATAIKSRTDIHRTDAHNDFMFNAARTATKTTTTTTTTMTKKTNNKTTKQQQPKKKKKKNATTTTTTTTTTTQNNNRYDGKDLGNVTDQYFNVTVPPMDARLFRFRF
jgi:hypothetical protein